MTTLPPRRVLHAIPLHNPPNGRAIWLELFDDSEPSGVLRVALVRERTADRGESRTAVPSYVVDALLSALAEMRERIVAERGPHSTRSRPITGLRTDHRAPRGDAHDTKGKTR